MNRQLLFPERKRCGVCRCYFGPGVIDGLFCSRICAGLPALPIAPVPADIDPADLPRYCSTRNRHRRNGAKSIKAKVRYQSERDALEAMGRGGNYMNVYRCPHCSFWHIGHRQFDPENS